MDKGAEQDPVTKLTIEMAQTNGYLKSFVANQERTNSRMAMVMDKVADNQSAITERLAVAESQAACVPDLYKGQAKMSRLVWMGVGAVALISILTGILSPIISPVLARLIK